MLKGSPWSNRAKIQTLPRFLNVLLTCANEDDPIKNEVARVLTRLYVVYFRRSRAANSVFIGGIMPKFQLIQPIIIVIFYRENEEDQSKIKALKCLQDYLLYKSMGIFSDAQGQLIPQSRVKSGTNSNSSEILWLSSLPARMKKIRSKLKALMC